MVEYPDLGRSTPHSIADESSKISCNGPRMKKTKVTSGWLQEILRIETEIRKTAKDSTSPRQDLPARMLSEVRGIRGFRAKLSTALLQTAASCAALERRPQNPDRGWHPESQSAAIARRSLPSN